MISRELKIRGWWNVCLIGWGEEGHVKCLRGVSESGGCFVVVSVIGFSAEGRVAVS